VALLVIIFILTFSPLETFIDQTAKMSMNRHNRSAKDMSFYKKAGSAKFNASLKQL